MLGFRDLYSPVMLCMTGEMLLGQIFEGPETRIQALCGEPSKRNAEIVRIRFLQAISGDNRARPRFFETLYFPEQALHRCFQAADPIDVGTG